MIKRIFKLIVILILIFLVSSLAGVVYYKMAPVQVTPLMLIRSVSPKGTPAQAEQEKTLGTPLGTVFRNHAADGARRAFLRRRPFL